jgi:hypothetical protein
MAQGANLSYQALTAFCRRHGITQPPQQASGHYELVPGAELQHDTSPHQVEVAGKLRTMQTASAVLARATRRRKVPTCWGAVALKLPAGRDDVVIIA